MDVLLDSSDSGFLQAEAETTIHGLQDDVLLKIFSHVANNNDWTASQAQVTPAHFVWLRKTLPRVCRRWASLLDEPVTVVDLPRAGARKYAHPSCVWHTVHISVGTEMQADKLLLRKRPSESHAVAQPPHTSNGSTGVGLGSAPASGMLATSPAGGWAGTAPLKRDSVSFAPYGTSPPTPTSDGGLSTFGVGRKSVAAAAMRAERVLDWMARKGRHCRTLYMDFRSTHHDFSARCFSRLMMLVKGSLQRLVLVDSPGMGHQEAYEALSGLKALTHLHVEGIPQDFLHLTMPYLCMLPSLQALHFKPDLAAYPHPAKLGVLPSSLTQLELVNLWIEALPPPFNGLARTVSGARSANTQVAGSGALSSAGSSGLVMATGVNSPANGAAGASVGAPTGAANSSAAGLASAPGCASSLQDVSFRECHLSAGVLASLAAAPSVCTLSLHMCSLTPHSEVVTPDGRVKVESLGALPLPANTLLEGLTLTGCGLRFLAPYLLLPLAPCLKVLDLHANAELGTTGDGFPPEFGQLSALTSLDLSGCGLTTIPAPVAALPSLERLCVESNSLSALPPKLGFLRTLRVANIAQNRLPCLPPCLLGAPNLEELVLSSGPVAGSADFPDLAAHLPRLRRLQVKGNMYDCKAVRNLLLLDRRVAQTGSCLTIDILLP